MRYKATVQRIKRQKQNDSMYVTFPIALVKEMGFTPSENVEWIMSDKKHLILYRPEAQEESASGKKNSRP